MARSGAYRYQVRLERRASATNALNEEVGDYAELATVPARLFVGTGTERREAAQETAVQVATFQVRADPDTETLTANDRLRFDPFAPVGPASPIWNIQSVVPSGSHELDITAVRKDRVS